MPNLDGTGPWGFGPGTGRGLGPCGRGRRCFGFGRRFGRGFRPPFGRSTWRLTEKEEKEMLEDESKYLEAELKEIKNRLEELKG